MMAVLDFTDPHLLRTEEEYDAAVMEVDALLDADPRPGTKEFDRLEFLSVLIEEYEGEHEPASGADLSPRAIVDFMLEQNGLTRADLTTVMGGKSRVSEFFSGKRDLSREQIKALREMLGIPADLLLR